ncbi:MAG: NADPH-dependent FMN reductase [Candidatus Marinimicrobia bacterium]|nr:NADPH-dependent FMN reductase [Candidatus Neomarinimicrobiota bacterium]|tara:strand:- start:2371 stop:2859 length:489 start_codon:yes stop_codon:yes gene_type:complete
MSKILIISATSGTNLALANKISDLLDLEREIINLEDFIMPLYTPNVEQRDNSVIKGLCEKFIKSDGFVFCAPEYNGGSPPILTNTITWLSVTTKHWREVFVNKKVLIATHSGGAGSRFLSTFRVQLEHLGSIVYPRTIMVNSNKKFKVESVENILTDFIELI